MRLSTKIATVNVIIIVLTVLITLSIVITDVIDKSINDIANTKKEELLQAKTHLKNVVDIGYELVNGNYKLKDDSQYLISIYGHAIRESLETFVDKNEHKPVMTPSIEILPDNTRITVFKINAPDAPEPWRSLITNNKEPLKSGVLLIQRDGVLLPAGYKKIANTGFAAAVIVEPDRIIRDLQEKVKHDMRKMLYDNGQGYIFVNDMSCRALVNPSKPEIEGTDFSNVTDGRGKKHVPEMVEICRVHNRGYLTYYWMQNEKDMTNPPSRPKLSYVRLFEPWGWIIGSGTYVDSIERKMEIREREMRRQVNELVSKVLLSSLLITLGMILFSIIFAETLTRPIVKLIKAMKSSNPENLTKSTLPVLGGGQEIKELGQIFNNMLKSINYSIKTIRETTITKEKIESEMEIARKIQLSLLPKTFPDLPDNSEFKIHGMISAARSVGGDLYDFFYLDEHHICFAVGDVSGKGVPASLFMMLTRTILRAKVKPSLSTGKIVTAMNKLLCENNDMSMFVSFFMGILNLQTGKLNYCNAGHNLPHLLRNDGRSETLPVRHGIPLGIIDQEPYFDDSFTLKEGDKILIYTDGVARGQNYLHEMFGEVKIQSVIKQLVHLSPRECVKHLHDEVIEFIGNTEQDDDIAILAVQYMGHEHGYKTMKLHNTATSN